MLQGHEDHVWGRCLLLLVTANFVMQHLWNIWNVQHCGMATVSEPLESSAEEQGLFWREKNDPGTTFTPAVQMQLMGARNLIVPGIKGTHCRWDNIVWVGFLTASWTL